MHITCCSGLKVTGALQQVVLCAMQKMCCLGLKVIGALQQVVLCLSSKQRDALAPRLLVLCIVVLRVIQIM